MRVLLFGGTGQVGTEIRALASGNVDLVAPGQAELDLKDAGAIATVVGAAPWDVVINAAAYTDVDRAEREEAAALVLNADAPSHIAIATGSRGIPLIHISTDYVFDGRKGAPYVEQDEVSPLNAYGRSKLAGERAVAEGNPRHIILRTSWVYSRYRKNFVKTILRLAFERDRLSIVADQHGCPTAASDIARACLDIAMRCASERENTPYGVYHFAGAGEATWFQFASAIIELAGKQIAKPPQLVPIQTIDYPTPATRPLDTRLNCTAIAQKLGIQPQRWDFSLRDTIDGLLTNGDSL